MGGRRFLLFIQLSLQICISNKKKINLKKWGIVGKSIKIFFYLSGRELHTMYADIQQLIRSYQGTVCSLVPLVRGCYCDFEKFRLV